MHRDDGAVGDLDLGAIREERRDVAVRADAEEAEIEGGPRSLFVAKAGELCGVRLRSSIHVGDFTHGRQGVDVLPWDVDVIDERGMRTDVVALGVPGGQETLVAPPQMNRRPVDVRAPRMRTRRAEYSGADGAACCCINAAIELNGLPLTCSWPFLNVTLLLSRLFSTVT